MRDRFVEEIMAGVEYGGNEVAFTNIDTGMTNKCIMVVFDKTLEKSFNFTINIEEKERIMYLVEIAKHRRETKNVTRC